MGYYIQNQFPCKIIQKWVNKKFTKEKEDFIKEKNSKSNNINFKKNLYLSNTRCAHKNNIKIPFNSYNMLDN